MRVGQSHLLDDIIDNLEMETKVLGNTIAATHRVDDDPDNRHEDSMPSYYAKKMFMYALGEQHGLFERLGGVDSC